MKKVLAAILAVLLMLSAFGAAFAETATPDNPNTEITGEISFWTQDDITWTTWFQPAVEEFRKAYPNVKVTDEYFPTFADKMTQAFAGGQEPDVTQTWQSPIEWAKAGRILEIPASFDLDNNYLPGALESKKFDGKYFCAPSEINVESPSLYVNLGLLEQNGVALPEGWIENNGPKSWAELLEFAKSLTIIEGDTCVQSGLTYTYAQWEAMFCSLIWQYGGDYRDPENNKVHFDTPEAKSAAEFLLKYNDPTKEECVGDRNTSRYDLFVQGTAAMTLGAPWYAGSFNIDAPDIQYQVFNCPPFVDGSDPYCVATGGWGYIVSANTKYPEASWAFVDFMNSAVNNGSWAIHCGTLAARKDAVMDLNYDPNVGSVEKALAIASNVLPYGREDGAYTLSPSKLIYTIIRLQLQQLLETGDIDTALKTMEAEGNAMIEENLNR